MKFSIYFFLSILFFIGCTEKVTEPIVVKEVIEKPKVEDPNLSPCPKFSDIANGDEIMDNYVIYRDAIKAQKYDEAFELWKTVYENAPAADGKRNTVYADGITLYEAFIARETDTTKRNMYIDEIFGLYDAIKECYPKGGYVEGRKGFDYYYKYPERSTSNETFALFKQSLDTDGVNAQYFVINPFTALLIEQFKEKKISISEAQKYVALINDAIVEGKKNPRYRSQWAQVEGYAPLRLEEFEGTQGFYNCDYYKSKYYAEFEANPTDCEVINNVYSKLKWAGCDAADTDLMAVSTAKETHCKIVVKPKGCAYEAWLALQDGDYSLAAQLYADCAETMDDSEKKAKYYFTASKIYYGGLKKFSQARKYARLAAKSKSGWGEPYILIGKLYASSGPLCGPGTGWDSQIVTWVAIDKWNYAKKIDPNVASEARKQIRKYHKYMPTKEDIFFHKLKPGDPFKVNCWINESTIVRPSD